MPSNPGRSHVVVVFFSSASRRARMRSARLPGAGPASTVAFTRDSFDLTSRRAAGARGVLGGLLVAVDDELVLGDGVAGAHVGQVGLVGGALAGRHRTGVVA